MPRQPTNHQDQYQHRDPFPSELPASLSILPKLPAVLPKPPKELVALACGALVGAALVAMITKKYVFDVAPIPYLVPIRKFCKTHRHWLDLGGVEYDDD